MRRFLLIALALTGLLFVAAPESKAGVSIGIGIGYPGYYYPPYPYGYYPYYPVYAPVVRIGYSRPYYWWHGRRCSYRGWR